MNSVLMLRAKVPGIQKTELNAWRAKQSRPKIGGKQRLVILRKIFVAFIQSHLHAGKRKRRRQYKGQAAC